MKVEYALKKNANEIQRQKDLFNSTQRNAAQEQCLTDRREAEKKIREFYYETQAKESKAKLHKQALR